jgi:DNA mismatch endonuclease (patch repair protein)
MMGSIRSKNTKPEILLRRMLHAAGFRYRLHSRKLPGTPDIVLPKHKAAIFVSGCFWHGHDCRFFRLPSTRQDFWGTKIEKNRANDSKARQQLSEMGWRHATVWECALRGVSSAEMQEAGQKLTIWLRSRQQELLVRGSQ